MNWLTFAGTFLAGAIAIGGYMWQKRRNKVGTISEVREHLGIPRAEPPASWTKAWVDGQERPLKIGEVGPAEVAYLDELERSIYNEGLGYRRESVQDVARRILEPIDRATGSDAAERGR